MRMVMALLAMVLVSGTAAAQLPGVDPKLLEQAPRPNPSAPLHQHVGEQYRVYDFPGTGEPIPYRLFVPETWTPERRLPVLVTLRAGNSINNSHRGGNELVKLARERGYIVISPLGYRGYPQPYYGSPFPVDREAGPSVPASGWSVIDYYGFAKAGYYGAKRGFRPVIAGFEPDGATLRVWVCNDGPHAAPTADLIAAKRRASPLESFTAPIFECFAASSATWCAMRSTPYAAGLL